MVSLKEPEITMRTQIELKKKFLAKEVQDHFAELPHMEITRCYLAFDKHGVELRLCKLGEARLLPLKIQQRDIRLEREIKLIQELRPASKRRCLRKLRNWMPHDGITVQIDVYKSHTSGTTLNEIAFPETGTSRFSQARLAR